MIKYTQNNLTELDMKRIIKLSSLLIAVIILVSSFALIAFAVVQGDLTGDGNVTSEDAIYALYHVYFPGDYAVNQSIDFDGNGSTNANDAIYLLYHVYFDTQYPLLNKANDDEEWTKRY